ncbi:MAG: ETC complex I subunit [Alphaproteobacteria bacterium]|nr:ETC complex I subunit [Alphaproteobacteria bacterium]
MTARIFRPAANAMQSGRGKSKNWILEFEAEEPRRIEPLMGYTSSGDMRQQVRLSFETLDAAEAYARREGLAYMVQKPHDRSPKRVAYPDNFRHDRKQPWTH